MTPANLQQWIQHPEALNMDTLYELRTLVARYPYFQSVRLLYLKNLFLLHDITFGAELRKSTLYVADRRALFYLIEGDRYALQASPSKAPALLGDQEEEPTIDRTLALIDAFLSTESDELSQPISLDYTTDYTSYLPEEEKESSDSDWADAPRLRGQDLIDGFIERSESESTPLRLKTGEADALPVYISEERMLASAEASPDALPPEEEEDDSCFTETLAKIYIKQQRYSKALEIIKKLSLKYPKKNGYFADQIRFLEKLIINAKSK